eukprot:1749609-Amphidinium_carterae.1
MEKLKSALFKLKLVVHIVVHVLVAYVTAKCRQQQVKFSPLRGANPGENFTSIFTFSVDMASQCSANAGVSTRVKNSRGVVF